MEAVDAIVREFDVRVRAEEREIRSAAAFLLLRDDLPSGTYTRLATVVAAADSLVKRLRALDRADRSTEALSGREPAELYQRARLECLEWRLERLKGFSHRLRSLSESSQVPGLLLGHTRSQQRVGLDRAARSLAEAIDATMPEPGGLWEGTALLLDCREISLISRYPDAMSGLEFDYSLRRWMEAWRAPGAHPVRASVAAYLFARDPSRFRHGPSRAGLERQLRALETMFPQLSARTLPTLESLISQLEYEAGNEPLLESFSSVSPASRSRPDLLRREIARFRVRVRGSIPVRSPPSGLGPSGVSTATSSTR